MTHKKYKTYTLWLLIITVTALVITAAMLSLKRSAQAARSQPVNAPEEPGIAYYTPNPAPSQENSETLASSVSEKFLITIYRGRIGVFQEGVAAPVLTADTEVYLLPEEDVALLKKGIVAQDLSEARRILEDYD